MLLKCLNFLILEIEKFKQFFVPFWACLGTYRLIIKTILLPVTFCALAIANWVFLVMVNLIALSLTISCSMFSEFCKQLCVKYWFQSNNWETKICWTKSLVIRYSEMSVYITNVNSFWQVNKQHQVSKKDLLNYIKQINFTV